MKIRRAILNFIHLKYFKNLLNRNPIILSGLLKFLGVFNYSSRETKLQNSLLRFCGAKIGKNVHIAPTCFILRPKNLKFEDNVIINDNNTFMAWNKITIKKNSFTSVNVVFVAGTHNVEDFSDVSENQEIIVGDGTWIGANCTIQGGAQIGCGSIVGTGAVVLDKKYDDFYILAGVPAKLLKKRKVAEKIYQPIIYNKKELLKNV